MVRGFRLLLVPALLAPLALVACGGGSSSPPPPPVPTGTAAAYICPSSDSVFSVAVAPRGLASANSRRAPLGRGAAASSGFVEVLYDRSVATLSASAIATREQKLNTVLVNSYDYPNLNVVTHLLAVAPADVATTEAALRTQPGVRAVAVSGPRRMPLTVSQEYFTSDPYFNGFISTVPPSGSHTNPPATYHVAPYDESAAVPGQWDMHAIRLGYAFEYSQANNGSSVQNAGALGSGTIKIAMIDTGVDSTHPELANKVAYQHCFVTNPNTGSQSTSSFSTDPDGHGTDVTGVAAANTNNAFGYAAAGGNVVVYGYRVFPTPDDTCSDQNPLVTPGPLCTAEPADVASAINDAIAKGVNVISLSLGGAGTTNAPACTGGVDSDLTEGQAINAAIAHNIVVVAAAGNDATAALEAPACDTGVIAVGASALDDGQPNGSGVANGSPSNPLEYVAGYSDYGSPGAAPGSASAWGIVAPGGDPSGGDVDFLHWIINIWTSTPLDSQFAGDCFDDYPNIQGTTPPLDCSTLIAGTSMATPHVAGAAALILAVNSTYQSPAKMKQLLCSTADDIGSPHEGCGRLNIYRAMAVALHDPSPP